MRYRFGIALAASIIALFTDAAARGAAQYAEHLNECAAWREANVQRIEAGLPLDVPAPNARCPR